MGEPSKRCEYFTRYGNSGVPGRCDASASLVLVYGPVRPMIAVCNEHAEVIVGRFPELGGVKQRFAPVGW